jgi:zinc protease
MSFLASLQNIRKKTLANGLDILVLPTAHLPKVSVQLWYDVGSKDERTGERGIAHFIEHMIFKGTAKLSESDINLITHKLSGYCNAFTSTDYTGYIFDFPSQNWHHALSVMADCMRNCSFRPDHMQSEVKAVIQELKMYHDDYMRTLAERMIGTIFYDHPYHFPIIGYKQDLWSLDREALVNFYQRHYLPNNAALVIVGDVDVDDALVRAEAAFASIAPDKTYVKQAFTHRPNLEATQTTLYRDLNKPIMMLAFEIPGTKERKDYLIDLLNWILGSGRSSRLYRVLVDELKLATNVDSFVDDMFDAGIFFICIDPVAQSSCEEIALIVGQQLEELAQRGPSAQELQRAVRKTSMSFMSLAEDNQKLAYLIGKFYTALGDETYLATYAGQVEQDLAPALQQLVATYFVPMLMHRGYVLPLSAQTRERWQALQEVSDAEDAHVLSAMQRESSVEEGHAVLAIKSGEALHFAYPQAESFTLSNGLQVLFYHDARIDKVEAVLDLKARHFNDEDGREGLFTFVSSLLQEGTTNYSAIALAQALESYGMSLHTGPGQIGLSMLSGDLAQGLAFLYEIVDKSTFSLDSVEHVRAQLLADLDIFWDTPGQFAAQLAKEAVYGRHPYHKNALGSKDTIGSLTQAELLHAYKKLVTPDKAFLALVGNLEQADLPKLLESTLGQWRGESAQEVAFSSLPAVHATTINYPLNRDQIVLCYAGLSVARLDADYDKLLLFDQIFSGGALRSMSSRLFDLRESSGLFYTISGSLVARADKQPGMVMIKTIVSVDRLAEAEKAIEQLVDTVVDTITQEEIEEARLAIQASLLDHAASYRDVADLILALERLGLPRDYLDGRIERLQKITIQEIKEAARKVLRSDKLIKIRVGRIDGFVPSASALTESEE